MARLHGRRWLLALPAFGWTAVFFFVPLAILLVYSLGRIDVLTLDVSVVWTLDNYARIGDALRSAIPRLEGAEVVPFERED